MKLKTTKTLLIASVISLASFVLINTGQSYAASFTVASGSDETTTNSSCSLSEAIGNINDQAATNTDCPAGDGANDTINLPAGTITLTADLPQITESITIAGRGMGVSVVDQDSAYGSIASTTNITVEKTTFINVYATAILSTGGNTVFDQIEVDGTGATLASANPIFSTIGVISENATADINAEISNIYVHDIVLSADQILTTAVVSIGSYDIDANISNITIKNVDNINASGPNQAVGLVLGAGLFDSGATTGTVNARVNNATINGIQSQNGSAQGVIIAMITDDNNQMNASITNSTITNISSDGTGFIGGNEGSALFAFGAAENTGTSTLTTKNLLLLNNEVDGCKTADASSAFGVNGTSEANITSAGGNLSDDTTCSSYFTQPSDQNNITNLGSFLAPLANNGGFVPTMALLQGSPAIDAGVPVSGLTTDARQATRPQGLAFDSGAYESSFSRAVATPTATLASTGQAQTILGLLAALVVMTGSTVVYARMRGFGGV